MLYFLFGVDAAVFVPHKYLNLVLTFSGKARSKFIEGTPKFTPQVLQPSDILVEIYLRETFGQNVPKL